MIKSDVPPTAAAALLGILPDVFVFGTTAPHLVTVVYHSVLDSPAPHVEPLLRVRRRDQFAREMDILASRFEPITLDRTIEALRDGRKLARPSLLVTFDDGMREVAEIAMPVLRARGIRPALFLNLDYLDNRAAFWRHKAAVLATVLRSMPHSDRRRAAAISALAERFPEKDPPTDPAAAVLAVGWRERGALDDVAAAIGVDFRDFLARRPYLSHDEVHALAAEGVSIGAHGFDHPDHRWLSHRERVAEVVDSAKAVRDEFGSPHLTYAFPFSDDGLPDHMFDELFGSGIDVTFGTSWPRPSSHARRVQRICFENSSRPVAVQLLRSMARGMATRVFNPTRPPGAEPAVAQ